MVLLFAFLITPKTFGQNFKSEQRKLEAVVNAAYRNKRINCCRIFEAKTGAGIDQINDQEIRS
jgi:hypothetical protein